MSKLGESIEHLCIEIQGRKKKSVVSTYFTNQVLKITSQLNGQKN